MTEEPMIDLDHPDPAGEPGRRSHLIGGRPRLAGLAMLVPACLTALAGAAPAPAPAVTYVGLIPSFTGVLPDDSLPALAAGLVVAQVQGEVFAHHPDGRPAWRTRPLAGAAGENTYYYLITEWEGSILLTRITMRTVRDSSQPSEMVSAALDPADGQVRWQVRGSPRRAGGLVVVASEPWDGPVSPRVYRSLPGDLLWTAPPVRMVAFDPGTDALMTLTDGGQFTEYQLSTGMPRRSAGLRLPQVASSEELSMRLFRDRLTIRATNYSGPDSASQTLSYDRDTLQPAAPSPLDRYTTVMECGPVLCASGREATSILDKDSLAVLWQAAPGDFPAWTDAGLLLQAVEPRLVDERTGEVRVDASGWTPVGNLRGALAAKEAMPALMTLRVGRRTYVARLTPRTVQVLGTVPQGLTVCVHQDVLLACRAVNGRTEVWRLGARM